MWRTFDDAPLRAVMIDRDRHHGRHQRRHGNVITTNQRDRTRSRYSRLATMKIFLSMARHPRLDARGADTLEEDLME